MADRRSIEVRGFKWPRRPTAVAMTRLLGEDAHGRWLGVSKGDPWRAADGLRSGVFLESLVKVVPRDAFWTACFYPGDPAVDVDIVLPVRWFGDALEEVDLELDVLRSAAGSVWVRDREEFDRVRAMWALPADLAAQAGATCERVRVLAEQHAEPFGAVGQGWLSRFFADSA